MWCFCGRQFFFWHMPLAQNGASWPGPKRGAMGLTTSVSLSTNRTSATWVWVTNRNPKRVALENGNNDQHLQAWLVSTHTQMALANVKFPEPKSTIKTWHFLVQGSGGREWEVVTAFICVGIKTLQGSHNPQRSRT